MKLVDLMPEWVTYEGVGFIRYSDAHSYVDYGNGEAADTPESSEAIANADGVLFLCPTCFKKNNGPVGTDSVLCWFSNKPHIPALAKPGPGRWAATGTSFDDLTLSPSVNVDNEHWHGFITNGEVT